MTKANDPVYPEISCDEAGLAHGGSYTERSGLTLRQHFAVLALQGLLAGPNTPAVIGGHGLPPDSSAVCQQAVAYADALIVALNAPKGD